jgi:cobalt transporter subunit CbtB
MTAKILSNVTAATRASDRIKAGLACLFIGAAMVFTVGLSQVDAVHNAAHDTRHAIGFPCH